MAQVQACIILLWLHYLNHFLKQALLQCVSISHLLKIKKEGLILPLLLIKQLKRQF